MIIGVPRERKTLEKRVALTPHAARTLCSQGHTVLIEEHAGAGSFFTDREYVEAGCRIVAGLEEVWREAELIVKVKEPHEDEYPMFRPNLAIFSYLHLAGLPEVARAMLRGQVTGIAYELVPGDNGGFPLLEPMSEAAGRLSVLVGCYFLLTQNGGRGVLLSGVQEVKPGRVLIMGAGVAGRAACANAVGLGADVTVVDISESALARLRQTHGDRVKCLLSDEQAILDACPALDLLIGAVLVPGARAPHVITRRMIRSMPRGSVFVDISVDQGGCSETTRTTSLKDPIYTDEGVIHYAVPNMPSMTARTSTQALVQATLPYTQLLANKGIKEGCLSVPEVQAALCTAKGNVTHPAVAAALGLPRAKAEEVWQ